MPRFRARPVEIVATQFWPPEHKDHVSIAGVGQAERNGRFWVRNAEGQVKFVNPGDWLVQEPGYNAEDPRLYPIHPDVLEAHYSPC